MRAVKALLVCLVGVVWCVGPAWQAHAGEVLYHVTPLGDLPTGPVCGEPTAVNALGMVTGWSCVAPGVPEGFVWDPENGMTGLGTLPAGLGSQGCAINAGGHVAGVSGSKSGVQGFFWSPATGMVGVGDLPGGAEFSEALGINDLNELVGFSRSGSGNGNAAEAFLWDPVNGIVGLGDLPGGQFVSVANDINNASQVVGWSGSAQRLSEAFIWDPVNGMRGLGTMPGGHFGWIATAINELGQVVGISTAGQGFFWDPAAGMILIGTLPGPNPRSQAFDVNDLGQVVGRARPTPIEDSDAFLWDRRNGMINLEEHLAADTDPLYRDLRAGGRGINNAGQIVAQALGQAVLLTPFVVGDMNCDDAINAGDVDPFFLALVDYERYEMQYPNCHGDWAGDVNQDARFDAADIDAFFKLLGG